MATKIFTKEARYTQPAWTEGYALVDGIYIDESFFTKNIPILGAVLTVGANPTSHARTRWLGIKTNVYRNGQVELQEVFAKRWYPFTDDRLHQQINLGSSFYGIGLNMLYIYMLVDVPTDAEVIYNVSYDLEVVY